MLHHYISLYFSLPPNSIQRKQLIDLLLLHKDRTKSWTHENIRRYFYKNRHIISSRHSRQQQNRIIHERVIDEANEVNELKEVNEANKVKEVNELKEEMKQLNEMYALLNQDPEQFALEHNWSSLDYPCIVYVNAKGDMFLDKIPTTGDEPLATVMLKKENGKIISYGLK